MKWHVKSGDTVKGPFSLKQLAVLILKNKVSETTRVQEEGQSEWVYAEDIPGLFRAVRKKQQQLAEETQEPVAAGQDDLTNWIEGSPPPKGSAAAEDSTATEDSEADEAAEDSEAAPAPSTWKRPVTKRDVLLGFGSLAALAVIAVAVWYALRPDPFPHEGSPELVIQNVSRLNQIKPPTPRNLTLDIEAGTIVEIPGVGQWPWGKCPSLSRTLCQLVFLAPFEGANQIFLCSRQQLDEPFGTPEPILTDVEGAKDFPSLSADGLELIFCRVGEPIEVWHTRRPALDAAFEAPQKLQLTGLETEGLHLDGCRWCGPNAIQLCTGDSGYTFRKQFIVARKSASDSFELNEQLPFANPWLRYAVTKKRNRAYVITESGILLTARRDLPSQFITPEVLVSKEITGPVDEQAYVFIAPEEDVLFFMGPGAASTNWEDNRLWAVRF